jgi:hypothetical protein
LGVTAGAANDGANARHRFILMQAFGHIVVAEIESPA